MNYLIAKCHWSPNDREGAINRDKSEDLPLFNCFKTYLRVYGSHNFRLSTDDVGLILSFRFDM